MKRYFLSIAVFLVCLVSIILLAGNSILAFVDLYGLSITIILPFIFVSILFGFREMASAFSVSLKEQAEKDKLFRALNFFKTYGKTVWVVGIITVIISCISLLRLDDRKYFGPYVALALETIFYCGIINVLIIIPFIALIKNKLNEK